MWWNSELLLYRRWCSVFDCLGGQAGQPAQILIQPHAVRSPSVSPVVTVATPVMSAIGQKLPVQQQQQQQQQTQPQQQVAQRSPPHSQSPMYYQSECAHCADSRDSHLIGIL